MHNIRPRWKVKDFSFKLTHANLEVPICEWVGVEVSGNEKVVILAKVTV
jgi:hypothetical protein